MVSLATATTRHNSNKSRRGVTLHPSSTAQAKTDCHRAEGVTGRATQRPHCRTRNRSSTGTAAPRTDRRATRRTGPNRHRRGPPPQRRRPRRHHQPHRARAPAAAETNTKVAPAAARGLQLPRQQRSTARTSAAQPTHASRVGSALAPPAHLRRGRSRVGRDQAPARPPGGVHPHPPPQSSQTPWRPRPPGHGRRPPVAATPWPRRRRLWRRRWRRRRPTPSPPAPQVAAGTTTTTTAAAAATAGRRRHHRRH